MFNICRWVQYFVLVGGILLSIATAESYPALSSGMSASGETEDSHTEIEVQLENKYYSDDDICVGEFLNNKYEELPAYQCSGVMLRGVRSNLPEGLNAWDPYPAGRTLDTSFSFFRSDIRSTRLAWDYVFGFIILPPKDLKVNCFFPLDGDSDRRGDNGCGAHEKSPNVDPSCKYSFSDLSYYERFGEHEVPWRNCRYDLKDKGRAAGNFSQGLRAARSLSKSSELPNDLKIETWKSGYDARLPIMAFFFTDDSGKPLAQRARNKYEVISGKRLPIVRVTFNPLRGDKITFTQEE